MRLLDYLNVFEDEHRHQLTREEAADLDTPMGRIQLREQGLLAALGFLQ